MEARLDAGSTPATSTRGEKMKDFTVEEFRFINTDDEYNTRYFTDEHQAWSRPYEYTLANNDLQNIQKFSDSKISVHNSAWGWEGLHIFFREDLESKYDVVNSDIRTMLPICKLMPTYYYALGTEDKKLEEKFDAVLNISVIEETNVLPLTSIYCLFRQVKKGGYLIATMDYSDDKNSIFPGLDREELTKIEDGLGGKIKDDKERLNGITTGVATDLTRRVAPTLNAIYIKIKKELTTVSSMI